MGDPTTFKVIQCHEYLKKRVQILLRGVIVPRYLATSGYNSSLQPKSDAYFPEVRTERGATSKNAPSLHQSIVDLPDIAIMEGGGKRRKLSSSFPRLVGTDRFTVAHIEAVAEKPSIAEVVPVPAN